MNLTDDETELTKQERLDTTCPACNSADIYSVPEKSRPEDLEGKAIFGCASCRKVYNIETVLTTVDGIKNVVYKFTHIADIEEIEEDG